MLHLNYCGTRIYSSGSKRHTEIIAGVKCAGEVLLVSYEPKNVSGALNGSWNFWYHYYAIMCHMLMDIF